MSTARRALVLGACPRAFAGALLALSMSACGGAPPPEAKPEPPRTIRVHVANGSRFNICRVEACGKVGRAVDTSGPIPGNPPLKPHEASLYEVRECKTAGIVAVACPDPDEKAAPCLKADGGNAQEGTMFRVAPCAL